MSEFAIAGVQMEILFGHDNLPIMASRLDILMSRFPWVEMVVFSELAAYGASLAHAQEIPGPAEEAFREMARKHGVWLLPGSIFEKSGDRIYNTATVYDPEGNVVGRHRKLFPFRPYEEGVAGGDSFFVFDVPDVGRFGVSICYDMWFPETTRTLASMGAEVILHPSLTNTIDREIELAIARASAAMNQVFFIDINGVGAGGYGRSIMVRPTGNVIHVAGTGQELIPVDVNLDAARRARRRGLFGLGQPLKSFRDREVDFELYDRSKPQPYLESLGPLVVPDREQIRAARKRK
ncbi:MAG: carbon-nitrogen hydrolase family protein [Planctomycetes bacterium]|nr:carbon-nitrogen hydrolase family protein [Planctomycetota bacterium]